MSEIKRSDKQYIEVEEFADYEFTSCIAYEMMIRNPKLIEIVKCEILSADGSNGLSYKQTEEGFLMYGLPDSFYYDYHFFKETLDIFESKNGWSLIGNDDKHYSKDEDNQSIKILKEYNGFLKCSHLSKDSKVPYFERNDIIPHYKRPKVEIYEYDNTASVMLDMSKPVSELTAFIEQLKKMYDVGIIQTPYDDFVQGISLCDTRRRLPKKIVMADIFYIYDALTLGYSRKKIQFEVYCYYADKGTETRTLDYKTLKKYYDFALDYIDNKRYLELATGKKLEDIKLGTLLQ